jgi:hypothetical protein
MELDDLKQTWKQNDTIKKIKNTDIMEVIQHKSYGPVAALKKAFNKQMRIMAILPLLIFVTNLDDVQKVFTNIMFWSYIAFCAGVIVYSWYNYQQVRKMEGMDKMVKPNLEEQIDILETRLRWQTIGIRIVAIYFIILIEVVPYIQHIRMLDKWHSLSPLIRFTFYAVFLALQYFTSRRVLYQKFGRYLAYLKSLIMEME